MATAIALLSGGLDSILAVRLVAAQGISVEILHFTSIFDTAKKSGLARARELSAELGLPIKEVDVTNEMMALVRNPRFGHGANLNPCIDCKILMLSRAKKYMEASGARFVVTGEVLGQRPMSQHRQALELIEKESGLKGLILRPLSARLLEPTIPEQNGLVDREKLLAHSGRSRKVQMDLAKEFEMKNYPGSAGGCLLTDPGFANRLEESIKHGEYSVEDIEFLKIGRHFRLLKKYKLIVGRDQEENEIITDKAPEGGCLIEPLGSNGPTSFLRDKTDESLKLALDICAAYCDGEGSVKLRAGNKKDVVLQWEKEYSVVIDKAIINKDDNCRRL